MYMYQENDSKNRDRFPIVVCRNPHRIPYKFNLISNLTNCRSKKSSYESKTNKIICENLFLNFYHPFNVLCLLFFNKIQFRLYVMIIIYIFNL